MQTRHLHGFGHWMPTQLGFASTKAVGRFAALLDSLTDGTGTARRVIQVDPNDLGLLAPDAGTPKQRPYAAILGCSDARVPIELIFNEGPNDLFVVRVAGNGLGSDVLGSLKYAAEHPDTLQAFSNSVML